MPRYFGLAFPPEFFGDAFGTETVTPPVPSVGAYFGGYFARQSQSGGGYVLQPIPQDVGSLTPIKRGSTIAREIDGLSGLSSADEVWFTAKQSAYYATRTDDRSEIQVTATDGLIRLARSSADSSLGSLEVVSDSSVVLRLDPAASAKLPLGPLKFGIQTTQGGVLQEPFEGLVQVVADVTRSTAGGGGIIPDPTTDELTTESGESLTTESGEPLIF